MDPPSGSGRQPAQKAAGPAPRTEAGEALVAGRSGACPPAVLRGQEGSGIRALGPRLLATRSPRRKEPSGGRSRAKRGGSAGGTRPDRDALPPVHQCLPAPSLPGLRPSGAAPRWRGPDGGPGDRGSHRPAWGVSGPAALEGPRGSFGIPAGDPSRRYREYWREGSTQRRAKGPAGPTRPGFQTGSQAPRFPPPPRR